MAWRVDVRTPRVLANALEKLADLSKGPAENDPAQSTDVEVEDTTAKDTGGTAAGGTAQKAAATRKELLKSGEEVHR